MVHASSTPSLFSLSYRFLSMNPIYLYSVVSWSARSQYHLTSGRNLSYHFLSMNPIFIVFFVISQFHLTYGRNLYPGDISMPFFLKLDLRCYFSNGIDLNFPNSKLKHASSTSFLGSHNPFPSSRFQLLELKHIGSEEKQDWIRSRSWANKAAIVGSEEKHHILPWLLLVVL